MTSDLRKKNKNELLARIALNEALAQFEQKFELTIDEAIALLERQLDVYRRARKILVEEIPAVENDPSDEVI